MRILAQSGSTSGHRRHYLELFESMFSATPVVGPLDKGMRKQLNEAHQVIISMIDEDLYSSIKVALVRGILGRPTAAFFLQPHSCFQGGFRAIVKRYLFGIIKYIPNFTIITITPFNVCPQYSQVAHVGVCDPQYWDLLEKSRSEPLSTKLSLGVARIAAGRPVCCALGALDSSKGINYLADILERNPSLSDDFLWVCAGHVPKSELALKQRLIATGAIVVDRFLTDVEIESLYGVSRAIWGCYSPERDQASGIFGRAMQLGVPTIVREGSVVHRFAEHYGMPVIPIEYLEPENTKVRIMRVNTYEPGGNGVEQSSAALMASWRQDFVAMVKDALKVGCNGTSN